jgi:hypothetical protein
MFEAMIMAMAKSMSVNAISAFFGEHDTKLWHNIHQYIN